MGSTMLRPSTVPTVTPGSSAVICGESARVLQGGVGDREWMEREVHGSWRVCVGRMVGWGVSCWMGW